VEVVVGSARIFSVGSVGGPVFTGTLKIWTMACWDVEEVDVEDEEVDVEDEEEVEEGLKEELEEEELEEEELEEDVNEKDEDVARGTTFTGTLAVGRLNILTVPAASVLEEVDSADEELVVDVGTGSPLDNTLPHGSLPKAWPVQPQRERQESTQFAPPQKARFTGCRCLESLESRLVS